MTPLVYCLHDDRTCKAVNRGHRCGREPGHDGVHACPCYHRWPNLPQRAEVTEAVLDEVLVERARQHATWGDQSAHPDGTGGAAGLHPSAARHHVTQAQEACRLAFEQGVGSWRLILEEEVAEAVAETDPARLRAELVQVAAVAVAWIEAIDTRTTPTT